MSFSTLLEYAATISGGISAQQVANMREAMLSDGKIENNEAEFLFTLKKTFQGRDNAPEWGSFWVEAMTLFLQNGENRPNVTRLAWLKNAIAADGNTDEMEQQLLDSLPNEIV